MCMNVFKLAVLVKAYISGGYYKWKNPEAIVWLILTILSTTVLNDYLVLD